MKKCPTCDKTFEDSMRFCQVDGTPLVDEAPAFDPYATIVASPVPSAEDINAPAKPAEETRSEEPATEEEPAEAATLDEASDEAASSESPSSTAIEVPDDVLDLPEADPLKTMYVSDDEMQAAMKGETAGDEPGDLELGPAVAPPEPPSFTVPDVPAPSFEEIAPPPSPFSASPSASEPPPPPFQEPEPVRETTPFDTPPPAPVAEWTPPPAPDANWQNQEIGSNTPFQPPPAGVGGQNKTHAIISLVCGILGMTVCCGSFAVSIAAIVLGVMARNKAAQNPQEFGGAGLAMGGIITGGVGILFSIVFIILYLVGALASGIGNF